MGNPRPFNAGGGRTHQFFEQNPLNRSEPPINTAPDLEHVVEVGAISRELDDEQRHIQAVRDGYHGYRVIGIGGGILSGILGGLVFSFGARHPILVEPLPKHGSHETITSTTNPVKNRGLYGGLIGVAAFGLVYGIGVGLEKRALRDLELRFQRRKYRT
jgi:hypothetical protein